MMEHQEQHEKEAEEAINAINKKTGRNMPQAIATGAVLVILILACLLISIDLFVYLVVLFMVLALWELRVDFATVGLHIPVVVLWVCSAATLLSTYYSERHIVAMTVCVLASLVIVAIAASAKVTFGSRISLAVADKLSHTDAGARLESSFNHERGEVSHSRLSHVAVSMFTVLYIPLLASCIIMPPAVWASRWWVPVVAGFMIGVAGTFGDLCASMLKRDIGIKDMGHLLKGHGGVMDRVDSILLCAPFVCVLLWATGM